ncbi:TPA: hypothetical protein ACH3X1_008207 [Trebouxia sp. C0004]
MASKVQQIKAGGGGGDSSQLSIDSYRESNKLSKRHNKALQRLLVLAIVMCGVPFACFVQCVDDTRIDSSVPFSAKEFDHDFTGSAEQVELPNMDFGVSTDAYDLNELL